MSKGFAFDPEAGTLTFTDGVRDALVAPGGTLINLLPDEFTLTNYDTSFPDVPKDRIYFFTWNLQRFDNWSWFNAEIGSVMISALPQEWSETVVLADAPDDTDIFASIIRLEQTVPPSHNWAGGSLPIAVMTDENVDIALTGSIFLEASLGFSRAMSIYIDNDPLSSTYRKLVLFKQQSIGTAPGGYGNAPGTPGGVPASISAAGWSIGSSRNGGEVVEGTTKGWPLYYPTTNASPHYRAYGPTLVDYGVVPPGAIAPPQLHRKGGSQAPTLVDPTDMGSTWRINLRGQFGRRS